MKYKIIKVGVVIIAVIIIVLFYIVQNIDNYNYEISSSAILNYMKTDERFMQYIDKYNVVSINQKYIKDEVLYFVELQMDYMWDTSLFKVEENNGQITDLLFTGLGGNKDLFSYDVIEITQGNFLVGYCSSHMGNGNLELVSLDKIGEIKYSISQISGESNSYIEGIIDCYYEQTEKTAILHGLSDKYGNDILASAVFCDDKLKAQYYDADNDGNTDIIFTGIQQIYLEDKEFFEAPEQEYYCKIVFLFNSEDDKFYYNEKFSYYKGVY